MPATQKPLQISLTPKMRKYVNAKVAAGHYRSTSDLIRDAIRLLQSHDQSESLTIQSIRAKLASGLAQAQRGELKDGDTIFDNIERGLDELARGRNPKRSKRKTSRAA